ncbi:hypothetical protein [Microbispora corallina]|uniref:hypothetical protein n=1 Tax=Microbispora corallina TaxID=83302 RepID=UPI0019506EB1|nr:hypothetical protein [Microbispora corallina]
MMPPLAFFPAAARSSEISDRDKGKMSEYLSREQFSSLARATKVSNRVIAAGDPRTDADILRRLADDDSPTVRRALASRAVAPVGVLRKLAEDPDRRTRRILVENPICPPGALVDLVNDPDRYIRWTIPDRPGATEEVHLAICSSSDVDLRCLLAERPDLDGAVTTRLVSDSSPIVRSALAAHTTDTTVLAALVGDAHVKVRAGAAQNPLTRSEQRLRLARDTAPAVRFTLIQSVPLDDEIVQILLVDPCAEVRWWLATMPSTPRWALEILRNDSDVKVATQAQATLAHHEVPPVRLGEAERGGVLT